MSKFTKIFAVPMAAVAAAFDTVFQPRMQTADGPSSLDFTGSPMAAKGPGRDEAHLAALRGEELINGDVVCTKAADTVGASSQISATTQVRHLAGTWASDPVNHRVGETTQGGSAWSLGQRSRCPSPLKTKIQERAFIDKS